jgi:hypothetical protein
VVGTKTGEVTFWTLPDATLLRVISFGSSIDRLEVAEDLSDSMQVLLVSAGGHMRVVLEEDTGAQAAGTSPTTLFQVTPARAEYDPVSLETFERQDELQVRLLQPRAGWGGGLSLGRSLVSIRARPACNPQGCFRAAVWT